MEQLLSLSDVSGLTSLGKTTIYVLIRAGNFPKNVLVSARRVAWKASDIQSWISQKRVNTP
jgi:prophage regulatory protein